jgi:hypothetical protein
LKYHFTKLYKGSLKPADPKNENDWVVARNIEEAY